MPSDGWDDAVELVDAPGRGSKRAETPQADPPEYASSEHAPPEYAPPEHAPPEYTPPRTEHATHASTSATTPFIENSDSQELAEQGTVTVLRSVQFLARFVIGSLLLIAQCVVVGLAANGMSKVGSVHEDAQIAIGILAVAGFIEVVWLIVMPILLCCCFSPALFMSLGLIGFEALGTSVYTLAVVGENMRRSACADQGSPEGCQDALNKGLAAACVRLVTTAPICLGITVLAIALQRGLSSRRAQEGRLMGWSLLILGKIDTGQPSWREVPIS